MCSCQIAQNQRNVEPCFLIGGVIAGPSPSGFQKVSHDDNSLWIVTQTHRHRQILSELNADIQQAGEIGTNLLELGPRPQSLFCMFFCFSSKIKHLLSCAITLFERVPCPVKIHAQALMGRNEYAYYL